MKKGTAKQRVLTKVPSARCVEYGLFGVAYAIQRGSPGGLIGFGPTPTKAWQNAAFELQRRLP